MPKPLDFCQLIPNAPDDNLLVELTTEHGAAGPAVFLIVLCAFGSDPGESIEINLKRLARSAGVDQQTVEAVLRTWEAASNHRFSWCVADDNPSRIAINWPAFARVHAEILASRKNGKLGGRPRKNNPDETQTKPRHNPDVTQTKPTQQNSTEQNRTKPKRDIPSNPPKPATTASPPQGGLGGGEEEDEKPEAPWQRDKSETVKSGVHYMEVDNWIMPTAIKMENFGPHKNAFARNDARNQLADFVAGGVSRDVLLDIIRRWDEIAAPHKWGRGWESFKNHAIEAVKEKSAHTAASKAYGMYHDPQPDPPPDENPVTEEEKAGWLKQVAGMSRDMAASPAARPSSPTEEFRARLSKKDVGAVTLPPDPEKLRRDDAIAAAQLEQLRETGVLQ